MKQVVAKWRKDIIRIEQDGVLYISVPFTWLMSGARSIAARHHGPVVVGGPGAMLLGCDWAELRAEPPNGMDFLSMHNPDATFTTRGCVRRCAFCAVPRIEGEFRELQSWRPRPIVCDNNILASSRGHFARVIDSLRPLEGIDFNQGLDARLFTPWHAGEIAKLHNPRVRFAFDHVNYESTVADAISTATAAGLRLKDIRVYVIIGFRDTPEDALYRLRKVQSWGAMPCVMRYQPLDALRKNSFMAPGWSQQYLRDLTKYFSRLVYLGYIPFEDYRAHENARRFRAELDGRGERRKFWRRIARRGGAP